MLSKLRERSQGESGFTLVELLVVMLILGLLAAIAIPAFFNQRDKAHDADAKASVHSAQVALETYATDHNGSYDSDTVTAGDLTAIEPTLTGALNLDISTPAGAGNTAANSYTISVDSSTGTSFTLTRDGTGAETVDCSDPGSGGCPSPDGNWGP
jgi:type IV pilus assembly protein PilA